MEEVKFCEDCKWCNVNRMSLWQCLLHIGEGMRCHKAIISEPAVRRKDKPLFHFCDTARRYSELCGKEGRWFEQAD